VFGSKPPVLTGKSTLGGLFPEFRSKTEISDLQSLKKPMKVGGFLAQIAH
jgi:hypothetical protein